MHSKLTTLIALTAVLMAAPAAHAGLEATPLALTGFWTGTVSCKGLSSDGFKVKFADVITVRIRVDDEGDMAMEIDGTEVGPATSQFPRGGDEANVGLCGRSIQAASKPGKGAAVVGVAAAAGTFLVYDNALPVEGVHFKTGKTFTANGAGVSGKLVGSGPLLPYITGGGTGACKVKLERTSPATPGMNSELLSACFVDTGI